ncbi:MAG TPA: hypothetical protein PLN19_09680 [Methanothrix sp.]|jgi:hypothetical protein|nr:hypothetical protein [Methanothrix sp.]HOV83104.1 hypothetical protein [Methanothrix sp.]HPC90606.1 hypothetical protein [Methanothrix sp.]HQE88516.1 hypothetical protein [Methanothrix sp.]HQI69065.1 hypothetical protein [Methanothrix sp.]
MRTLIFIYLAMFAISCVLLSAGTVDISRESGMDILANLTNISQNQSQNATQNATAANPSSSNGAAFSSDLWSWGDVPLGYTLDENGTLKRDASEEWRPSI